MKGFVFYHISNENSLKLLHYPDIFHKITFDLGHGIRYYLLIKYALNSNINLKLGESGELAVA